tara:strand:- start:850 stop:1164 length:315 start_codon:yes stop_codon:yes gene_type:complete
MIDFSGDVNAIKKIVIGLRYLIIREDIEYVDFWQHGIKRDTLVQAGFKDLDSEPGTIIPNFFEPYVYENGEIWSSLRRREQNNYVTCKGDGDQDRPSKFVGNFQ